MPPTTSGEIDQRGEKADDRMAAEGRRDGPGQHRAQHEELAMRDIDDPHDAEHQRQAKRHQRQRGGGDEAFERGQQKMRSERHSGVAVVGWPLAGSVNDRRMIQIPSSGLHRRSDSFDAGSIRVSRQSTPGRPILGEICRLQNAQSRSSESMRLPARGLSNADVLDDLRAFMLRRRASIRTFTPHARAPCVPSSHGAWPIRLAHLHRSVLARPQCTARA